MFSGTVLYIKIFFEIRESSSRGTLCFRCDTDFIILLVYRLKYSGLLQYQYFLFGHSLCSLLCSSKISLLLFRFSLFQISNICRYRHTFIKFWPCIISCFVIQRSFYCAAHLVKSVEHFFYLRICVPVGPFIWGRKPKRIGFSPHTRRSFSVQLPFLL